MSLTGLAGLFLLSGSMLGQVQPGAGEAAKPAIPPAAGVLQPAQAPEVQASPPAPQPAPRKGFLDELLGGQFSMIWVFSLMLLIFYLLVIRPGNRQKETRLAMLKAMKKGDTVVTSAGIIGRVHRVEEKEVLLQVDKDSNVKIRFLKDSITSVLAEGKGDAKGEGKSPDSKGEDGQGSARDPVQETVKNP